MAPSTTSIAATPTARALDVEEMRAELREIRRLLGPAR
jgi:hypothetical protein